MNPNGKLFKNITMLCRWQSGELSRNYFILARSNKKKDIQLESSSLSGVDYIYIIYHCLYNI